MKAMPTKHPVNIRRGASFSGEIEPVLASVFNIEKYLKPES